MQNCSIPAARASSTAYWISGLSTTGSISLAVALVAGRNRVPRPATGRHGFAQWLHDDRDSLVIVRGCLRLASRGAGGNVAVRSGPATSGDRITLPRETSASAPCSVACRSQQHVARLVDPRGQPVRAAAVRMGGAHQPVMGGADLGLGGPGVQAQDLDSASSRVIGPDRRTGRRCAGRAGKRRGPAAIAQWDVPEPGCQISGPNRVKRARARCPRGRSGSAAAPG